MNTLITLSVTALIAYFTKRLFHRIGLPIVTGYVIVGVISGISILKIFDSDLLNQLTLVNDLTLGIIGFTIGSEFRKDVFQQLGKSIFLIALFESMITFLLVTLIMFVFNPSRFYQALILGAVASATAPAASIYVIQQYKAKGPLSSTIMAVVGIDDVFALIFFVFALVISKALLSAEHLSFYKMVLFPSGEIVFSLILGMGVGIVFDLLFKQVRYPDDLLLGISGFLFLILGISRLLHLSGLLAVMAFGALVSNRNPTLVNRSSKIMEQISPLLYAFFFIFAGAHLNIRLLPQIGLCGIIYFFVRAFSKIGGASLGAVVAKAPKMIRRYIGFALIPQVGIAVALAIMVMNEFGGGQYGEQGEFLASLVINVLLFTTIITEVVGPILTKMTLTKAGERQV